MQVNSISYNPSRVMMAHRAVEQPAPEASQTEAPAQESVKSIYFTGKDDNGRKMRNATMGVLIPLSLLVGSGMTTGCKDEFVESTVIVSADASAEANASANASITLSGDGCHHGGHCGRDSVDTVYVTKYDTCYIDTGSYHHDIDTVYLWKDRYQRPIPLDTLTKHMINFDVDGADSVENRNIVHYEYTREWEYNNRVIANMNVLESDMNKNVLVHDVDVRNYKNQHEYYGKEVRRIPTSAVTLENKDGSRIKTDKGIFLELYRNPGDEKDASIFDSELENRYFLQTAGDSVKVYEYASGNRYVEKGKMSKGYLGENTILLKNGIGEYATDDHLVDVVVKAVNDDMLREMYARARDNETSGSSSAAKSRATAAWRQD